MKKVLVVDFDVEFLKSVSLMLREEGFEIITAVDGQAGLERFESDKPDLVILEAMLPRLHGFELCARITENQAHSAPVIVITGVYRDALYKTEALRTFGATAYFEKPVDMSRLMEAIRKALSAPAAGAQAVETKKAPATAEKPPVRPAAGVQFQTPTPAKPQPRPQPPPRAQAAPAVTPSTPAVTPPAPPPVQPAKKKDQDQFEIDNLLKSALAELGLETEVPTGQPKPAVASSPAVQPPRPVAPPPPPKPIQPPPRPATAPFIPAAARPVSPPQPKPAAPPPPQPQIPVQPVTKTVPPPQPKPVAPAPPPIQPRVQPFMKPSPHPQPKPSVPSPPKPEAPSPPPPTQQAKPAIVSPPAPTPPPAKPAIVSPPPAVLAPQPSPAPKPAPVPEVRPTPPPLRQPTPQKLIVIEKAVQPAVPIPAAPVLEMAEKRAHAPAFAEFIPEPKKKSSPAVFIAAAGVLAVAALGYFLVLKPKGQDAPQNVSKIQPPPVVSERTSFENAPRFESQPESKPAAKSQTSAAKPKPAPPPATPPEPETKTSAFQPVMPAGEAKLEIQIPEQTALQARDKPITEQMTSEAPRTTEIPATAAPAAPAKAQTGQLLPLEEVDSPPRVVTRVEPAYPPIAFRMGIQGTVWINALVSERGNVLQAIFLRGTTAGGLDKAAETAVLQWKYQPAQKDGVNVKVWLPVRVDFVKRS